MTLKPRSSTIAKSLPGSTAAPSSASPSPVTAETARDEGLEVAAEAEEHTIPGLIDDAATRFADNEAMVDGDLGVRVGEGDTAAGYRLADPDAVDLIAEAHEAGLTIGALTNEGAAINGMGFFERVPLFDVFAAVVDAAGQCENLAVLLHRQPGRDGRPGQCPDQ